MLNNILFNIHIDTAHCKTMCERMQLTCQLWEILSCTNHNNIVYRATIVDSYRLLFLVCVPKFDIYV